MRLYKRSNGYWYYEFERNRPRSLKTKDGSLAQKMFLKLQNEFNTLQIYKKVFEELKKSKGNIEKHYSKIISMIEQSPICMDFNGKNGNSPFVSEEQMQGVLLPKIIHQFDLNNVREYFKCDNGILDVLCDYGKKNVILEFKLNKISESHLGQCLRYLSDGSISAKELWLIGDGVDSSIMVFKDFPEIKLFVTTKSNRAKRAIRPFYVK